MYHDRFIYSFQIDESEITAITEYAKNHAWEKAQVTRGFSFYEDSSRTNDCFGLNDNDVKEKFLSLKLDQILRDHIGTYLQNVSLFRVGLREPFQFLRYNVGEKFDCHFDGTGIGLISNRMISAVMYLNDDFEGGELEFPFQNVTIQPKKGLTLIFPSNFCYAHIAKPVTQGTKFSVVTWYHSESK